MPLTSLNCAGKIIDLTKPVVMGVLNLAAHSFCETGRYTRVADAVAYGERIAAEGAAIIDVGGEPTHPGVHPVASLQKELDLVLPVVEKLVKSVHVPISVDTSKPEVMRAAIELGAGLINDVRALQMPGALDILANSSVAVCLMHMAFPEGKPANYTSNPEEDIVNSVKHFLQNRIKTCLAAGIDATRIVIDPGIGHGNFGKNLHQNLLLIKRLAEFQELGLPILIGVSRKTFIGEILNQPASERLPGSLAAAVMAVNEGANIIRAHDVKATVEAVKVASYIKSVK